jgi:serpin B
MRIPAAVALAFTAFQAHAAKASFCETMPPLTAQVYAHAKAAARADTDFGLALYQRVKGDPSTNVFLSPHSISTALAMTYAGASGETREAMAESLRLTSLGDDVHASFRDLTAALNCRSDASYELRSVNALWGQQGFHFNESFLTSIASNYDGTFRALDFRGATEASRETINDWVARQTDDRITNLLSRGSIRASTRLVLTNAIYYKAPWRNQFSEAATRNMNFRLANGSTIRVPALNQVDDYATAALDGVRVVELPFATSETGASAQSMIILMPETSGPTLAALEEQLSPDRLSQLRDALRWQSVDLTLPKFKFTSEFRLKDALKELGMSIAFSPQADFSGITTETDLAISDAIHKAYIDVNERGAEAAAATAVVVVESSGAQPEEPVTVRIDRPFLFLIVDKPTDAVLFLGRVARPAA